MEPWLMSGWVTAYWAVQVVFAAGARVVTSHVGPIVSGPAGAVWLSVMARCDSVTLPALLTPKV
jgi:hypothetical protein